MAKTIRTSLKSDTLRSALRALVLVCALTTGDAFGAEDAGALPAEADIPTAPVEIDGDVLFRVRGVTSYPAPERAATIRKRIEDLASDPSFDPASLRTEDVPGYVKVVGGKDRVIMFVADADAQLERASRSDLGMAYVIRIRTAIQSFREARTPNRLMLGAGVALAGTAMLLLALFAAAWGARRLEHIVVERARRHIPAVGIQSLELVRAESIRSALQTLLHALRLLVQVALVAVYIGFVLGLFPWTRGYAVHFAEISIRPLTEALWAVIHYIPHLVFLIVLFVLVRIVLKLLKLFFEGVDQGVVKLAEFHRDWALPTYNLLRIGIIALAAVVAYPYLPGSDSTAFKGISLFIGLVVSLGSTSAISNFIAGYMIIYRHAFHVGDRVKIGDVVGDVTEIRMQTTHLRTLKHEELIIPNSVLVASQVTNYSSLAAGDGLILYTTVGIGYETPWRQVEAMLLLAAGRTPGLLRHPPPFVLQRLLGDFCVNYELNVYCDHPKRMLEMYADLHRHILDVFNEYGVQIMTPAYMADAPLPKLVSKDQWYAAPAAPPVHAAGTDPETQRPQRQEGSS